jgi:hypothetical protein
MSLKYVKDESRIRLKSVETQKMLQFATTKLSSTRFSVDDNPGTEAFLSNAFLSLYAQEQLIRPYSSSRRKSLPSVTFQANRFKCCSLAERKTAHDIEGIRKATESLQNLEKFFGGVVKFCRRNNGCQQRGEQHTMRSS